MRRSLAWGLATALAVTIVLSCGTGSGLIGINTSGGGGNDSTSLQVTVHIQNFAFNPTVVNLSRGGVVTWVWPTDTVLHNVTFSDPAISSPTQAIGTHTVVFADQGTFNYRCTLHSGMNGSIVVH
jgi:plastocyanin